MADAYDDTVAYADADRRAYCWRQRSGILPTMR